MKLYGRYGSPFVRRVGVTLNVLGMPFEQAPVAVFEDWEGAKAFNPVVRIPALELDDGDIVIDSAAILDCIDEAAGDRALTPRAGKPRRDVLKLVAIAVGGMEKAVVSYYEGRFHSAEKIEHSWVERCDNQARSALEALDAAAAKAGADGWLYGDAMTQADISAAIAYSFTDRVRPNLNLASLVPNLAAFSARLEATPAFQAAQA